MPHSTNILIKGFYRTGSHALVDLLSEYDNVGILPFEFNHFRAPANVADQLKESTSQLWPNQINEAIKSRSLRWRLPDAIMPDHVVKIPIFYEILKNIPGMNSFIKKKAYIISLKTLNKFLISDISFEDKIERTKIWLKEIGLIYAKGKDFLVFDQPIFPSTSIEVWPQVFEPFKMIYSIRNPIDQFADIIRSGFLLEPFCAPRITWAGGLFEIIYGRDRAGALAIFRDAVKRLYDDMDYIQQNVNPENILIVEFEKLVSDYQYQVDRIENFIGGLKGHHAFPGTRFIPELSVNNIGIQNSFLTKEEIKGLAGIENAYRKKIVA